jgi:hypothetical protein
MTHRVCPLSMNNNSGTRSCIGNDCMAWVPEQRVEYRCTLDIKDAEKCPLDQVVDIPVKMVLFCDGCQYYKVFEIKIIPAHCKLIKGIL